MIDYIFQRILLLSLAGTLATAIILPLSFLTKRVFSSRWRYYSCVLVLIVFLTPLSFKVPARESQSNLQNGNVIVFKTQNIGHEDIFETATQEHISEKFSADFSAVCRYGFFVWLFGCVGYLSFNVICYTLYIRHLHLDSVPESCSEQLSDLGYKRLSIRKTDKVLSPLLTGIIRPVLFLPDAQMSDKDIQNILLHECVHCKRFDIAVKWLCIFAKSVHWFNPAVFLLTKEIDIECEISCDVSASKGLDQDGTLCYCETILSLITQKSNKVSPALCMADTKRNLERRFKAIMEEKGTSKKIAAVSAIAAAIIILITLTASAILGGTADNKNKSGANTPLTKKENSSDITDILETNDEYIPVVIYKDTGDSNEIATLKVEKNDVVENVIYEPVPTEEAVSSVEISHGFDNENHPAVDYKLKSGTVITSPIDGRITVAEYASDKGNHIEIEGSNGTTRIIFAHLDKMYVSKGDKVNAGDTVGTVGSTGRSTGPHLHVEYYENGKAENPVQVFIIEENGEILAVYSKPEQILD